MSLKFWIIASCFNCQGSWRSEVRVNLSCCALGYGGAATWSLDRRDPACYPFQTIRFCIFVHSSTCRSWKTKSGFQLSSRLPSTPRVKQRVLNSGVFECSGNKEGWDTKRQLFNNASAAMQTAVSERLVAASHL